MTAVQAPPEAVAAPRRPITVAGPSVHDPRLWIASVVITLQVLGQTLLHFDVSIAQILVSILTCALIEVVVTFVRRHALIWPASAMLTGNGIAFVLRVPGTQHGDWWSMRGAWIFAGTGLIAMLSKYLVRVHGSHIFNPSNIALVIVFLVLGPKHVEPLDFWWGPVSWGVMLALCVIVVGAVVILSRLGMLRVALAFIVPFAIVLAMVAALGHDMTAHWHVGPMGGAAFWWVLVTSPEVFVFACFMITDPKTAPTTSTARVVYGVAIGVLAALLVAPQRTEYASKVAVLGSLVIVCAARPVIEWLIARRRTARGVVSVPSTAPKRRPSRRLGVIVVAGLASVGVVAAGAYGADTPGHTHTGLPDQVAGSHARPGLVRIPHMPTVSVVHDQLSEQIDAGTARAIAHDVADDFVIQEEAERTRSVALAIESADRSHLQSLLTEINGHRNTSLTVADYDAERLVVSVALRPGQAAPAILTTTRVRERDLTYDPRGKLVRATKWRSGVVTYEAWWSGEHYVLVSTIPPPGWHAPNV
ncbi:MAG TPA: RnfABCDGE type electron transport complex subunit D [Acidimicrobiia bacterium]